MTAPTVELNEGFSEPGATAVPWSDVERVLSTSEMFFLSTVRGDGRFGDTDGRTGLVYRISPAKVLSFGKGPYSQTRYVFSSAEDRA